MSRPKRISIFVKPHPRSPVAHVLGTSGGITSHQSRGRINEFYGAKQPRRYEVVFSLHKAGPLKVGRRYLGCIEWVGGERKGDGLTCCHIPPSWKGRRIKRTVFVGTKEWKPRRKK